MVGGTWRVLLFCISPPGRPDARALNVSSVLQTVRVFITAAANALLDLCSPAGFMVLPPLRSIMSVPSVCATNLLDKAWVFRRNNRPLPKTVASSHSRPGFAVWDFSSGFVPLLGFPVSTCCECSERFFCTRRCLRMHFSCLIFLLHSPFRAALCDFFFVLLRLQHAAPHCAFRTPQHRPFACLVLLSRLLPARPRQVEHVPFSRFAERFGSDTARNRCAGRSVSGRGAGLTGLG